MKQCSQKEVYDMKKNNEKVIVRYYPDGRVVNETKGLKGVKCEEVTDGIFKNLSAGRGTTTNTSERHQGGDGTKRSLRQG